MKNTLLRHSILLVLVILLTVLFILPRAVNSKIGSMDTPPGSDGGTNSETGSKHKPPGSDGAAADNEVGGTHGPSRHGAEIIKFISKTISPMSGGWLNTHTLNKAFADTSLLLLVVTLALGPLSRLNKNFKRFLSWRKELGIWSAITATIHVLILIITIPGFLYQFLSIGSGFDSGFVLANLVGIIGWVYLMMLALISNKSCIKWLGKDAWDYLQQKSYITYIMVIIHTIYFMFLYRYQDWIQTPFLIIVLALFLLQWIVFFIIARKSKITRNKNFQ